MSAQHARPEEAQPLFIAGASRSGTTLVNRILGRSGCVAALPELHFFGDQWRPDTQPVAWTSKKAERGAARLLDRLRNGVWSKRGQAAHLARAREILGAEGEREWHPAELFTRVLGQECGSSGVRYFTDQTPRNVFYLQALLELYPKARVVCVLRDPRAVLFSQRRRWMKRWMRGSEIPLSNALRVLANYHPITMMRLWGRSIRAIANVDGHARVRLVCFEALVGDPDSEVHKLCDFLEVPFAPEMLDVPQVGSSYLRNEPGKRGVRADTCDGWRTRLPRGDIAVAELMAGDAMRRLGYAPCARAWWSILALGSLLRLPVHVLGSLLLNPRRVWIQLRAISGGPGA